MRHHVGGRHEAGALAGPVRPDDAEDPPGGDGPRHVFEGLEAAEADRQVPDGQHGGTSALDDNLPILDREHEVPVLHLAVGLEAHGAEDRAGDLLAADRPRDRLALEVPALATALAQTSSEAAPSAMNLSGSVLNCFCICATKRLFSGLLANGSVSGK